MKYNTITKETMISGVKSEASPFCIICNKKSPNGYLCRDCFKIMKGYLNTYKPGSMLSELKDHYFNLKYTIIREVKEENVAKCCSKLYALAVICKDKYDDESLTDRVVSDIKYITSSKKNSESQATNEEAKKEFYRTLDGHQVRSNPESIIDDILYELRIVHCYERKVPIDIEEKALISDWFIPVLNNRNGIYIEYWGMKTDEYLANKERKKQTYKENNIPLIEIEKDDYLDKQGLSDRLIQEINKLAKKVYKVKRFLR